MFLASRFVAGKTAEAAIAAAAAQSEQSRIKRDPRLSGRRRDFIGWRAKRLDEYIRLLQLIHEHKVRAAISLKVSQMGILLSREVCLENLRRMADRGRAAWPLCVVRYGRLRPDAEDDRNFRCAARGL